MPEMYEPSNGGQEYNVPLHGDVADAPLAFKNFSESMPPEYVPVKDITATYEVLASDNGHILVASSNSDVTFAGDLPEGFNVALTLSASGTITLNGVVGEESIPFEKIGSVVKAGGVLYSSVSIGEIIEVEGASGGPTAPTSITVNGNVVSSGPAGEGDAGPPIAYGAKVTSELEGDTFTWELEQPADPILNGPEVSLFETTPFTNYQVEIFGLNVAGRGEGIVSEKFQLNYNEATGGDVPEGVIVDNYNGTNEKWKVHTFTTATVDKTFQVSSNTNDFRVLCVAGGGGGSEGGGGGGAGGMLENESLELDLGDIPVTVGKGGALKANGQDSSLGSFLSCKGGGFGGSWVGQRGGNGGSGGSGGGGNSGNGGGGGTGTVGQGHNGSTAGNYVGPAGGGAGGVGGGPNNGRASTITGSSVKYAGGGGAGPWEGYGGPQGQGYGGGGGGGGYNQGTPQRGSGGKDGVVIVAYQIGTSTTRQIEQAEAEKAARQAGVEQGIEQGYSQAQEDLQEELTSLRTQIAGAVGTTETMLIGGKEQEVKRTRRGGKK